MNDSPGEGPLADMVLRGYNRKQVDAFFERAAREPALLGRRQEFDVALWGYDRHQIDERFAAELRAFRRLNGETPETLEPYFEEAAPPPHFDLVLRGYDRRQVDEFITAATGPSALIGDPAFTVVWRGYDVRQVDEYVAFLRGRPDR